MNQKNKIVFLSTLIVGVLTLTLGVTFAVFNFNKTSTNSKLVVGDIYMHYNENNQLVLENAMPSSTYDSANYFEFTIDGKNTTTDKDIYYEIVLSHGDSHETRTTRIKDNLLKFTLVEIKDEVEKVVLENRSYNDLTSKRIWTNTISKNTTSDINYTYRLYMWISNDTVIGNVSQDYTIEEWNNVYASIKVNVNGDFVEKSIFVKDASCFETTENEDGTLTITDFLQYGTTINSVLQTNINCDGTDVIIPSSINGKSVTTIGNYAFKSNQLTSVEIPNSVTTIGQMAFGGNKLTSVEIPNSVTTIGQMAFGDNKLISIVIPDSVTTIGGMALAVNQLTSVTIGSGIQYINLAAFGKDSSSNINLSSITINRSCSDIKNIPASSTNSAKYYPWLHGSPYTASGVTIYGSSGEVCDSY